MKRNIRLLYQKSHKKRILFIGAAAVLLLPLYLKYQTRAVFNPDTAIHIDAASIENSTLIIGTHLIYLGSLNDFIYQIAMESAEDSAQLNRYYKSELGGGQWFDISAAASLSDIMENGEMVEDSLINGLDMTHHTKSDGVTYDLRTNKPVCIFNIVEHYELEKMPELEPLKTQYDLIAQLEVPEVKLIKDFFKKKLEEPEKSEKEENGLGAQMPKEEEQVFTEEEKARSDALKLMDEQILTLQDYYLVLKNMGAASAETDAVTKVMDKLESERQKLICTAVSGYIELLESGITDLPEADSALLTAIGDSRQNLEDSLTEHDSNLLEPGTTAATQLEYRLSRELIDCAMEHKHSDCDTKVARLIHLDNIMTSSIVSKAQELGVLDELVLEQEKMYLKLLGSGESTRYTQAVSESASHVLLENIRNEFENELNSSRSELQFYIQAAVERMEETQAQGYIKEKILESGRYIVAAPEDAYESSAVATAQEYVQWLQSLLAGHSLREADSQLEELYAQKSALEEEKLAALDKQKVREAKKIEVKLEEVAAQIERKEGVAAQNLEELENQKAMLEAMKAGTEDTQSIESEIANLNLQISVLQTQLVSQGDTQNIQNIQEMKGKALDIIKEGKLSESDLDNLGVYLDGLTSILDTGSALALQAVKDVYKEMMTQSFANNLSAYDKLLAELETAVENSNVIKPEVGIKKGMTASRTLAVLENKLGGKLSAGTGSGDSGQTGSGEGGQTGSGDSGQTGSGDSGRTASGDGSQTGAAGSAGQEGSLDSDTIAAVIAVSKYSELTGREELGSLAAGLAADMGKLPGSQMFVALQNKHGVFAPASELADYLNYRYLWNETKKTAVLAKGSLHYSFTAYSPHVERGGGNSDEMSVPAEFKTAVYIPQDYIYQEFKCTIYVIPGTDNALFLDEDTLAESEELLTLLQEEGGG